MAFRRSRSGSRSSRPRRPMDWGYGRVSSITLQGSTTAAYILPPTVARSTYTDPTIMRLIVKFVTRNQGSIVSPGGVVVAGIIAWDDINDTPDDIPNPAIFGELDWMIRVPIGMVTGQTVAVHWNQDDVFTTSAAKRKLGNTKGLLLVVGSDGNAGAHDWTVDCRYLLKE